MRDGVTVENTSSFNQSSNQTCQVGNSGRPFFILVYTLLFVVGFILNGFIVKFYFCGRQRKASSSIKVYLKNLVAADFLLCLCLPVRIIDYATSSITIRLAYCYVTSCVLFVNMYASILFMGYIAANRYLKVVRPTETHILQTVRAAHIVCTVTWIFLLASTSTYIILSFSNQKPHQIVTEMRCEDLYSTQQALLYKIIHICCMAIFFLVLVCLLFFYCSTLRRVSLVQQRDLASFSSKKLVKSHRNMLVLVSVFCVCFIPYHIFRLTYTLLWKNASCSWSNVLYYLMELTTIVSLLNVCLDPLIYFFICKAFRRRFSRSTVRRY